MSVSVCGVEEEGFGGHTVDNSVRAGLTLVLNLGGRCFEIHRAELSCGRWRGWSGIGIVARERGWGGTEGDKRVKNGMFATRRARCCGEKRVASVGTIKPLDTVRRAMASADILQCFIYSTEKLSMR